MLKITVKDINNNVFEIANPLSVVLNSSVDVPADDLTVTVPYSREISEMTGLISVEVQNGGKPIFKGSIDEIVNTVSKSKAVTRLSARSLAGALLDNEAEPVTYVNPASKFIFERHLKPFGITAYDGDEVPFYGSLKIEKGMTHWQVLESFCRSRYKSAPFISGDGKAYLRGFLSDETLCFDLNGKGSVPCLSLKEIKKPCKLISEVKLKLDEYSGYTGRVINKNPDCRGIERVRYVNAAADNSSMATADRIIESGNKNSSCISVDCSGARLDVIGKNAVIEDELTGCIKGLRVCALTYRRTADKEITAILLRKEKF